MKNIKKYDIKYEIVEDSAHKMKQGIVLESFKSNQRTTNYKMFNYSKDIVLICNETEAGFCIENHFHDWIEFSYVLEGEQEFMIRDKMFTIYTGDFLMINFGEMHGSVNKTRCKKMVLQIKRSFINQYLPELDTSILYCNSSTLKTKAEFIIYNEMINEFKKLADAFILDNSFKFMLVKAQIFIIFYKLNELVKEKGKKEIEDNDVLANVDINDIIRFINQNYQCGITMNEIATKFKYSPSFISRFFKDKVGMNFLDYINELKLSHAEFELVHTDKSISEICYSCGYNNSKSFFNSFKNKYNLTPKQYRDFHKK